MEQDEQKKKVWLAIVIGVVVLILLLLGAFLFFGKDSTIVKKVGGALPFGQTAPDAVHNPITGGSTLTGSGNNGSGGGMPSAGGNSIFRQLTKEPVAGLTTILRDGQTYVRYVLRENGNIHEVDPGTGTDRQLTIKTIQGVYEAYFGNNGNTVVLRYLRHDPLLGRDVIVSYLADLNLSSNGDGVGTLVDRTDKLPDDISAVTISPDGTHLFYLLPVSDGVSGTIVPLTGSLFPKEVLRNTFSEWLPQIFDDGMILLTTKPSAQVPGFSYLYNPVTKTLTRVVRNKKGLTTLGDSLGKRILFNSNIAGGSAFGMYTTKAFSSEEGVTNHETSIPITTLPEKCAWGTLHHTLYCGSFSSNARAQIPDDWYQGLFNFNDTFWAVNTDTAEIAFIADPQKDIQRNLDVTLPLVDQNEKFLLFVDKHDDSLWSMQLPAVSESADIINTTASDTPPLTPAEQKDASGTPHG